MIKLRQFAHRPFQRMAAEPNNPDGIAPTSPRLAHQRLPWVNAGKRIQRGCGESVGEDENSASRNRVAVGDTCGCPPRVAHASQPWAPWRNPFGITRPHATPRPTPTALVRLPPWRQLNALAKLSRETNQRYIYSRVDLVAQV